MTGKQERTCIKRLQQIADVGWNDYKGDSIGHPYENCYICNAYDMDQCFGSCPLHTLCVDVKGIYPDLFETEFDIYTESAGYIKKARVYYKLLSKLIATAGLETVLEDV